MFNKIDHLGIVVRDLDAAVKHWQQVLGRSLAHREVVADQGVEVASFAVGESDIELITPIKPDTGVARFLEKRGEGLHHVCYEVDDLRAALDTLAARGQRLIDREPRVGAGGDLVAFVHPQSSQGVLTELKQSKK